MAQEQPKGKTAYFVFCETHRAAVRDELMSAKEDGAKVSVAEEAKALGQRWKQLTDEQRQQYKDVAAKNKQAEQEAKVAQVGPGGGGENEDAVGAGQEQSAAQGGLPLSAVRRIIMSDKEVGRVSKDAAVLIGAAAEVFLDLLAEGCGAAARNARPKRRTIKLDDFAHIVRSDRRFVAAGMKDVVSMVESIAAESAAQQAQDKQAAAEKAEQDGGAEGNQEAQDGIEEQEEGSSKRGRGQDSKGSKRARTAPAPPSNPITSFFARVPPKAANAQQHG
mmetsp:Transcript_18645/g.52417  ORF Transcript_18645/g.52417 Transcript_18645/m.52417 type:complete len:277 (+) Transcript_18645:28-858(+)